MSEIWYGVDGQEQLDSSIDECIERYLDECEDFDFTFFVYEFRTMKVNPKCLNVLEQLLETLDEEYGNPEGCDWTQPTESMVAAEKVFVEAVLSEYQVWACERSGTKHKIHGLEWVREHCPDWLAKDGE